MALGLVEKYLGVPYFKTTGISNAILTILMKSCTITPLANDEMEMPLLEWGKLDLSLSQKTPSFVDTVYL